MSMAKKIRQLLIEKDTNITQLASLLHTKPQNITNKLSRDNFTEKDLVEIAKVLGCKYESKFIVLDENGNAIKEIWYLEADRKISASFFGKTNCLTLLIS